MMQYDHYHFWGMHLIWWFVWISFLFWIFATPYNIPVRRTKKDTPLDILKKRLALGEIDTEAYQGNEKVNRELTYLPYQ